MDCGLICWNFGGFSDPPTPGCGRASEILGRKQHRIKNRHGQTRASAAVYYRRKEGTAWTQLATRTQ